MIDYFYKLDYDDSTYLDSDLSLDEAPPVEAQDLGEEPVPEEPAPVEVAPAEVEEILDHISQDGDTGETHLPQFQTNGMVDRPSQILPNVRMYAMADKYSIWGLQSLAKAKFKENASTGWNDDHVLFSLAIREVYESTPEQDRGLREIVVETARKHIKQLRDRGDFNKVLKEVHQFTHDLLLESLAPTVRLMCAGCEKLVDDDQNDRCYYCPKRVRHEFVSSRRIFD